MIEVDLPPGFDDGKAPEALRTIGEVAKALGLRQHVLRYWEVQFPGLKPVKRSGGRRYYRPEDVQLIVTIDRLVHREGYTLRGARQAIEKSRREDGQVSKSFASPTTKPTAFPVDDLQSIRNRLAEALAQA